MTVTDMVKSIREVSDIPIVFNFECYLPEQEKIYGIFADGVTTGSDIVKIIAEHGAQSGNYIRDYVKKM